MAYDLCGLVRRDHDDLDSALAAMVDPATPPKELANLLDIFRLALAVHTATETRVLDRLVERVQGPRTLAMIALQARTEHVAQRVLAESMTAMAPGSIGWYEAAIEMRTSILDHAFRADQTRWSLRDHVPEDIQRDAASEYATERMRVLASTSPLLEAQRRVSRAQLYTL